MKICDIGGIKDLELSFNSRLNLICGMNGVGKTTILECIAHAFSHTPSGKLKKNSRSEKGRWSAAIEGREISNEILQFRPEDQDQHYQHLVTMSSNVFYIKEQRQINYQQLHSVARDISRNHYEYSSYMLQGLRSDDIKSWFINRASFESQGRFSESELYNLSLAKKSFELLDSSVEYSHIIHDTLDIIVSTTRGEVYFEYLSSGFKSCLFIILGLIKEIEINFKDPKIKVSDYDGIILIDEADAHLHPRWQGVFINVLKEIFINAQIIATTHSPHMVQEADAEEIIALGFDEVGEVCKLDLVISEYGLKGWTIEEILEDVMGLKETKSNTYLEIRKLFEDALENEDIAKAREYYEILKLMLHPRNPMKKIYELQLGTIGE
jgi:predicted ATP-dependent endonuclease of OLD family